MKILHIEFKLVQQKDDEPLHRLPNIGKLIDKKQEGVLTNPYPDLLTYYKNVVTLLFAHLLKKVTQR